MHGRGDRATTVLSRVGQLVDRPPGPDGGPALMLRAALRMGWRERRVEELLAGPMVEVCLGEHPDVGIDLGHSSQLQ
jgi:hypothetical protein